MKPSTFDELVNELADMTEVDRITVRHVTTALAQLCAANPAMEGAFMRKVAREEAKLSAPEA